MPMGVRRLWRHLRRDDRGNIPFALIASAGLFVVAFITVAVTVASAERSNVTTNDTLLTQRVDAAVGEALTALAEETNPLTPADANVSCETNSGRSLCSLWWTDPVPADATEPLRYNIQIRTWVDDDRDEQPPLIDAADTAQDEAWPHVPGKTLDPTHVTASLVPAQAITYQTSTGLEPQITEGQIHYTPSPPSLFTSAMHAFNGATLQDVTARAYNSMTTDQTGIGAAIASDDTVAYEKGDVDRTVLFGGNSTAGNHNSRCTGDACTEADVTILGDTHTDPTPESVAWIYDKVGTVHNGDWVSSEQDSYLPAGNHVINGNLVIDSATLVHGNVTNPTNLYVYGTVTIKASLNAPTGHTHATPSGLRIYSAGNAVAIDPGTDPDGPGIAVASLLYAPQAVCGTSNSVNAVNYFGSLVCDTISITTEWNHSYDDGALLGYIDPVPGAEKAWTYAPAQLVDLASYTPPAGWSAAAECVMPTPTGAGGYWKLDEAYGKFAADSSGNNRNGQWSGGGRDLGVCGYSAVYTPSGAVPVNHTLGRTSGASFEYWAKSPAGVAFEGAGYTIEHTPNRKVTVSDGSGSTTIPFTVQNIDKWHLYTVTINSSGTVNLYIDGLHKGTAPQETSQPQLTEGTVTIGRGGQTGQVDEVVYYPSVRSAAQIANRWTDWNDHPHATFTPSDPGTPFGAPTIRDNGTTHNALKIAWTKPTGTFPAEAGYELQVADSSTGPWRDLAEVSGPNTLTWQQNNPDLGTFWYRVGAEYNGDVRWSNAVEIETLSPPSEAPTVTVGNITHTSARYNWGPVDRAERYEVRWRINGGSWTAWRNKGTARQQTVEQSPRHGDKIELQARAANAAGIGPVSSSVVGQTTVRAISGGTIAGRTSPPQLEAHIHSLSCPAGTRVQDSGRVQWDNGSLTGWSSWGWSDHRDPTSVTRFHGRPTTSYMRALDVGIRARCANPDSGQVGPMSSNRVIYGLQHNIPRPTGVWVEAGNNPGKPGYREVHWGATCAPSLTPRYAYTIRADWGTASHNSTSATAFTSRRNVTWGPYLATVKAWCRAADNRPGPGVTVEDSYAW